MPNQGLAAGLDSVSSQIQWNLDAELAAVAGQFEAPVGNLILLPLRPLGCRASLLILQLMFVLSLRVT